MAGVMAIPGAAGGGRVGGWQASGVMTRGGWGASGGDDTRRLAGFA